MPRLDPEARRKYRREWNQKNRDKIAAYNRKRKLRPYHKTLGAHILGVLQEYKEQQGCSGCGLPWPGVCLDFHHINGREDSMMISRRWRFSVRDALKVVKEIGRCTILCSNCHRMHHYGFDFGRLVPCGDLVSLLRKIRAARAEKNPASQTFLLARQALHGSDGMSAQAIAKRMHELGWAYGRSSKNQARENVTGLMHRHPGVFKLLSPARSPKAKWCLVSHLPAPTP